MFLILIVLGHGQQVRHILRDVHRIAPVDENGAPCHLVEMVVKNFRMFLFLRGRVGEDGADHMQSSFLRLGSGKGIAVPGLALSCERPHQVVFCDTV